MSCSTMREVNNVCLSGFRNAGGQVFAMSKMVRDGPQDLPASKQCPHCVRLPADELQFPFTICLAEKDADATLAMCTSSELCAQLLKLDAGPWRLRSLDYVCISLGCNRGIWFQKDCVFHDVPKKMTTSKVERAQRSVRRDVRGGYVGHTEQESAESVLGGSLGAALQEKRKPWLRVSKSAWS